LFKLAYTLFVYKHDLFGGGTLKSRDMFMVFMMFVILFVVMISPQKGSLQFKDMLMYLPWLAVYLVTVKNHFSL